MRLALLPPLWPVRSGGFFTNPFWGWLVLLLAVLNLVVSLRNLRKGSPKNPEATKSPGLASPQGVSVLVADAAFLLLGLSFLSADLGWGFIAAGLLGVAAFVNYQWGDGRDGRTRRR
jgi:hypothetical protein